MGSFDTSMFFSVEVVLAANAFLFVIMICTVLGLWRKLRRLRRSYETLMNGIEGVNMEKLLQDIQGNVNNLKTAVGKNSDSILSIKQEMSEMKSHVGIVRYNAYGDGGSDYSFSIAVTDDQQNGFILTGLHHREQSFVYAKPLNKGQSFYTLSPEEKKAITLSSRKGWMKGPDEDQ